MTDIKRFTGFIAPDGTTHTTEKAAIAYTKDLKVKAALATAFGTGCLAGGVEDDRGSNVLYDDDVAAFLFDNRTAILAAFNTEVLMRKPRAANKVKAIPASAADAKVEVERPIGAPFAVH